MVQSRRSPTAVRRSLRAASGRQRLERAIELYLRDCFRTRSVARVSELAERLGASRSHLSRLVPLIIGQSLGEALRQRQLAYAARLLADTALAISEVAAAAAFGTARSFFRAFRKAYGQTPASYRSKCNQMSVDERSAGR